MTHQIAEPTAYFIEPTASGWRVLSAQGAIVGEQVLHRQQDVALAYIAAATALERYLAALDRRQDAADLFETWRALDERYEMLALERNDAPRAVKSDPWDAASLRRH